MLVPFTILYREGNQWNKATPYLYGEIMTNVHYVEDYVELVKYGHCDSVQFTGHILHPESGQVLIVEFLVKKGIVLE